MKKYINEILNFENKKVDSLIINDDQIKNLVKLLLLTIDDNIDGDVTEFGCYVGESSKYLMKTLDVSQSRKKLYVYDSFEGLPDLSKWEENSGWTPGTLKSSEDILIDNFKNNKLPLPIIHKDWFNEIPEEKIPEKISFAFLDGDFYNSIYDSLSKIYDNVSDGGIICFHDYNRADLPGVKAAIDDFFNERNLNNTTIEICKELGVYRKNKNLTIGSTNKPKTTVVTGIWDIKRHELGQGWGRSFDHYLNHLKRLMKSDVNMIIFIEEKFKSFVEENRDSEDTLIVVRELDWFIKNNDFFDRIQNIRVNPNWYNQSGWLPESTQAKLEMYNPIVMSKMFLLNDASILDPFNSEYLIWVDGALTNTVHEGYFNHDNVISNIEKYFNKFSFVCFPYGGKIEIHGFEYGSMCRYAGDNVNKVARGGIFGGPKSSISKINEIYYSLMNDTLSNGYMGTEESIFTIMLYKHPELIQYFEINEDGLLGTFFENLKNSTLVPKCEKNISINTHNKDNVALYVLTYNSPKQFEKLCMSFEMYDKNFLDKPTKFLINNSLDHSTDNEYSYLCNKYGFEEIKKDNIGICGGRQFAAEHSEEHHFDYHMFFEDDMFFYIGEDEFCKNGFKRKIKNLYSNILNISWNENFDFLKFNFTEFFGDNSKQWAWHNVPEKTRKELFPEKPIKNSNEHDAAPFLKFKNIKSFNGIPYASGEIYYCNWPQIVSKEGNRKMFLDTKWAHPFEQTWMSYIYQETISGKIKPGVLLATPTEHNRFDFYSRNERREN